MKSKIAVVLMCLSFSFLAQNVFATSTEVDNKGCSCDCDPQAVHVLVRVNSK